MRVQKLTRILTLGGFAAVAIGLLYLARNVFDSKDTIDFKYIWLAGTLWGNGLNPYLDYFYDVGARFFPDGNSTIFWLYPPNWWLIATTTARLDYDLAKLLWRILTAFLLLGGAHIISRLIQSLYPHYPLWRRLVFAALLMTMSATAVLISLGQTSALLFLGICLFAWAWIRDSVPVMTLALILLALKPNLGLAFAAMLLPMLRWWPALGLSFATAMMMATPAYLQHGVYNVLSTMLAQLSEHGSIAVNTPPEMTGIRHLADAFFGVYLDSQLCLLVVILLSLAVGLAGRHDTSMPARITSLALVIALAGLNVPLHFYDWPFLALLLPLTFHMRPGTQVSVAIGLLVLWRANNLEWLFGLTDPRTVDFAGSLLGSLAILWMTGWIFAEWRARATHQSLEEAQADELLP